MTEIQLDPRNANKGTERGEYMLGHSLSTYGAGRGPVADKHGVIIAGNKTVAKAMELGIPIQTIQSDGKTLYVIQRTDLDLDTDPAAKELAIADNRTSEIGLEWDADVLSALAEEVDLSPFWHDDELAELLAGMAETTEGLTDPDAVPDLPKEAVTRPGDVWVLGRHRLMCGDSTVAPDVETLMMGENAAMVYTDPPYGVDYDSGSGNEKKRLKIAGDEKGIYAEWLALWRVFATDKTPFYVWFADRAARQTYDAVEDAGLSVRALIIWNKLNAHYGGYMAQYMQKHEPCLYCHIGAPHWYGPTNEVTVWDVEQPSQNEYHPTQKPTALAERAIKNSSKPGDLILDLFGGSGSTLIACEQTGRRCAMMELDPLYCDVIVKRWSDFTGLTATLAPTAHAEAAD